MVLRCSYSSRSAGSRFPLLRSAPWTGFSPFYFSPLTSRQNPIAQSFNPPIFESSIRFIMDRYSINCHYREMGAESGTIGTSFSLWVLVLEEPNLHTLNRARKKHAQDRFPH